jgi:creatinine amidohydrolase
VLDEIGRNGFKKIILLNAHGGNEHFLPFLAQCSLWEQKPYSVYLYTGELSPECEQEWQSLLETPEHGHACECESSVLMASYPELVDLDNVSPHPGTALHRLSHLPANYSGIWWYADYPEHYAGDARPASLEKGTRLRQIKVDAFAEYIQAVKADQVVPALEKEFFERESKLRQP